MFYFRKLQFWYLHSQFSGILLKCLKISIVVLLPSVVSAQYGDAPRNGVGINLSTDFGDGLSFGLRYTRRVDNVGVMKMEVLTNFNESYKARLGLEFLALRWSQIEMGLGFDLRYSYIDYARYGQGTHKVFAVEMPIELRYYLNHKSSIFIGTSLSRPLWTDNRFGPDRSETNYRVGINYHF